VQDDPGIEVIEHALVVDLLQDEESRVCGVTLHVIGEGQMDGVGAATSRAVVLATGGLGQVYSATTNPSVATGDGMAAALRAGAVLADVEFVQFHPTVLWLGEGSSGQQPLISEAVRGEGAFLVDRDGVRFMQGRHPLADLAPRDVVSRAIVDRMQQTGERHVFLDARHLGREFLEERFPSIVARCRELGFDPATELLPVAPGMGDPVLVVTTLAGQLDLTLRVAVELRAQGDELAHPRRPLVDEGGDGRDVTDPAAGDQGVVQVLRRRVPRVEGRGDAALGPLRRALVEHRLGHQQHPVDPLAQSQRGRQPGDPGADHDDVGGGGPAGVAGHEAARDDQRVCGVGDVRRRLVSRRPVSRRLVSHGGAG
jgi:hypothetical protein